MIDMSFIVRYTDGLYNGDRTNVPTFDEFRDMFSSGQLTSKEWAVKEFLKLGIDLNKKKTVLAASWFGTLGFLLKKAYPYTLVTFVDIDPRCEKFIDSISYTDINVKSVTLDIFDYDYFEEDFIVNTSCEHIANIDKWVKYLPKGKLILLQSNNSDQEDGHINTVKTKEEFEKQVKLSEILFSGELHTPMYTRLMIIGYT